VLSSYIYLYISSSKNSRSYTLAGQAQNIILHDVDMAFPPSNEKNKTINVQSLAPHPGQKKRKRKLYNSIKPVYLFFTLVTKTNTSFTDPSY